MRHCHALQATMHAALSAHMKRATNDAHKPLPASIRWFGKLCVAYGSALVALLVSGANCRALHDDTTRSVTIRPHCCDCCLTSHVASALATSTSVWQACSRVRLSTVT